MAHRLGVRSNLKTKEGVHVPSLGLGSAAISPLDMASAYATLAAGGIYSEPMAIRKVVLAERNEDKEAGWGRPQRKRVVADWVADEVTKISRRTSTPARHERRRLLQPPRRGQDRHDGQAHRRLVLRLHAEPEHHGLDGISAGQVPMENVHGIEVAGGTFPTIIWNLFMRSAIGNTPEVDFPEPSSEPTWVPFERGKYANDSYYDDDDDDDYYYAPPEEASRLHPRRLLRLDDDGQGDN